MLRSLLLLFVAVLSASASESVTTLTDKPPVAVGLTKAEVLSLMKVKPEHSEHGKCSGIMPDCPLGHKWEMLHFDALEVHLVDGKVASSRFTSPRPKTSKLDRVLNGVAAGLYATQQLYYAHYCPQIRSVPLIALNANQYQFLQACIAAGY